MKAMHTRDKQYLPFLLIAVFSIADIRFPIPPAYAAPAATNARVIAVNDGDTVTLLMNGKEYRSRLIGMDAPEMGQEPWGRRGREHLRRLLKAAGWRVAVETGLEQYDKYNRLLVYLWTADGEMLNERMVRDGYAVLFTIQPNGKYAARFAKAQRMARDEHRGIWGADGLKETPLDYKKSTRGKSADARKRGHAATAFF